MEGGSAYALIVKGENGGKQITTLLSNTRQSSQVTI